MIKESRLEIVSKYEIADIIFEKGVSNDPVQLFKHELELSI